MMLLFLDNSSGNLWRQPDVVSMTKMHQKNWIHVAEKESLNHEMKLHKALFAVDPRLNWSLKQSSVASEFPFFCKRMTRRTKWWTLDWLHLWFAILFFCVVDGFTGNAFLCLLGTMFLQLANIVKLHELQWCIIVQGAHHSHNLIMFMPCCSIGNCWMIKRSVCLVKQISLIEIISTAVLLAIAVVDLSGVFHAVD